jgi:hypothetical protein
MAIPVEEKKATKKRAAHLTSCCNVKVVSVLCSLSFNSFIIAGRREAEKGN